MTFSDAGSDNPSGEHAAEKSRRPRTGAAARQARYRANHQLRSMDVRAQTQERIARICAANSLNTQDFLVFALDCAEDRLRQEQSKSPTPRRKRLAAETSPVTPNPMQQELF